jgi:hypothetical protein
MRTTELSGRRRTAYASQQDCDQSLPLISFRTAFVMAASDFDCLPVMTTNATSGLAPVRMPVRRSSEFFPGAPMNRLKPSSSTFASLTDGTSRDRAQVIECLAGSAPLGTCAGSAFFSCSRRTTGTRPSGVVGAPAPVTPHEYSMTPASPAAAYPAHARQLQIPTSNPPISHLNGNALPRFILHRSKSRSPRPLKARVSPWNLLRRILALQAIKPTSLGPAAHP